MNLVKEEIEMTYLEIVGGMKGRKKEQERERKRRREGGMEEGRGQKGRVWMYVPGI